MALSTENKCKLKRLADAMLLGVDILHEAGVEPLTDPAYVHLAEGQVAIYRLLYPDGVPLAEGTEHSTWPS